MTQPELEKFLPGESIDRYLLRGREIPDKGILVGAFYQQQKHGLVHIWEYNRLSVTRDYNVDSTYGYRVIHVELSGVGRQKDILIGHPNVPVIIGQLGSFAPEEEAKDCGGEINVRKDRIDIISECLTYFKRLGIDLPHGLRAEFRSYPYIHTLSEDFENDDLDEEFADILQLFPSGSNRDIVELVKQVSLFKLSMTEEAIKILAEATKFILSLKDPLFG